MAALNGEVIIPPANEETNGVRRAREKVSSWFDWLVGGTALQGSSLRQVYVVSNEDWPAVETTLSEAEAFDAIIALHNNVDDVVYDAAMKDLANARPPVTGTPKSD